MENVDVRVVSIEDASSELCGGLHIDNTGYIGSFKNDDDDKSVGKWLMRGTLLSASSMFPIVRDIASGTTLLGGAGKFRPSPALEAGSAFIKAIDSGAKAVVDIWDGEDVEAERVVKNMVEAGGYAFGLPSVQLLRWYKTFVCWANGEPDWSPWELIWHKRGR